MNGGAGSIASLIDVRALLDTLVSQGWQSAVIRVGDCEFQLSRDELLDRALPVSDVAKPPTPAHAAAPGQLQLVSAPHVGTLEEIAAVGSMVTKGGQVAVLSVLGERFEIFAPGSGQVLGHKAEPGALVEYGQVLAEMSG